MYMLNEKRDECDLNQIIKLSNDSRQIQTLPTQEET